MKGFRDVRQRTSWSGMHGAPSTLQWYLRDRSCLSSFVRKAIAEEHVSCQTRKPQLHSFSLHWHTRCNSSDNLFETHSTSQGVKSTSVSGSAAPLFWHLWVSSYSLEWLPPCWSPGICCQCQSILINKGRCSIILPSEKSTKLCALRERERGVEGDLGYTMLTDY